MRVFAVALALALCGGCGNAPPAAGKPHGTVSVMYAGSLTALMEHRLGPRFLEQTGWTFQGEGKGSLAIANLIRDGSRRPDVFISADPAVNQLLQPQFVDRYTTFAATEMVLAWSPKTAHADLFAEIKAGKRPWWAIAQGGLRLGRTDPELDPKGYRTLFAYQLDASARAAQVESGGPPGSHLESLGDIYPEEQLVARLQVGELDAGLFYKIEAVEAGLPFTALPKAVNQGDPKIDYSGATYTDRKGRVFHGAPIEYTVAVLKTASNPAGGRDFAVFLAGPARAVLAAEGLRPLPA
ncbi:MAG: hypothetical protein NVS9B1_00600 [Candidatus Dormibacteraceae bacterium]